MLNRVGRPQFETHCHPRHAGLAVHGAQARHFRTSVVLWSAKSASDEAYLGGCRLQYQGGEQPLRSALPPHVKASTFWDPGANGVNLL